MTTSKLGKQTYSFQYNGPQGEIVVTAHYIPAQETWGLICRHRGIPTDFAMSNDPWTDAHAMIDEIMQTAEELA